LGHTVSKTLFSSQTLATTPRSYSNTLHPYAQLLIHNCLASQPQHVFADANSSLPTQRPSVEASLGLAHEHNVAVEKYFSCCG
jgi:hypothetical protein